MGASDGPVFATPRPGSKPIISDPCGCPECVPGEGLTSARRRREREDRLLGPVTKRIYFDLCPTCDKYVITTAVREEDDVWRNSCKYGHTWRMLD